MQLRLFEADVHNSMEGLRRDVPAIVAVANATSAAASTSPTAPTATTESNAASAVPSASGISASTAASDLYWISDPRQAPSIAALEEVNVSCTAVLPKVEEVLNKGGELIRIFESVAVNFPAGNLQGFWKNFCLYRFALSKKRAL